MPELYPHHVPCSLRAVFVWVLVAPENPNADQRFLPPGVALACAVAFSSTAGEAGPSGAASTASSSGSRHHRARGSAS